MDGVKRMEIHGNIVVKVAPAPRIDIAGREKHDLIINAVAKQYGVARDRILSHDRTQPAIIARQLAMYIARKHFGESLPSIADVFGVKVPTVLHHIQTMKTRLETDPELRTNFDEIMASVSTQAQDN